MSDLDDLVVLDPDDREFGAVRRQPSPLPVPAVRYPADALPAAVVVPSGGGTVLGPVGEQATPIARTQAHTRDIALAPVPRLPAAEKIAHEAHEPPALASPFVGSGVDPASASAADPGVTHLSGDRAEHELHSGSAERITSCFERQHATGNVSKRRSDRPEKVADHVSVTPDATGSTQASIAGDPTPIPPLLLTRLTTYSQGRLQAGEGGELLRRLAADVPALITTYRIGYLPARYQDAVGKQDRPHLHGLRMGNRLVLPAFDVHQQVVDLLGIGTGKNGDLSTTSTASESRGLLAPTLATACDELLITDAVSLLIDCFRQGFTNTLLLRGVADARLNAIRLAQAGVRRVIIRTRHDDGGIAVALGAAGIDVSGRTVVAVPSIGPDAPQAAVDPHAALPASVSASIPDDLRLVSEDRTAEVILLEAGPLRYAVERHHLGDDPRRLVVVRARGITAQDRLDLTSEPQRTRFAGNAGQRLNVPAATIAAHLAQIDPVLAGRAQAEQERRLAAVPDADRSSAEAILAAPNLLERICADYTALGWLGEERAKAILTLTGISRLLPSPLWSVYRSSAATAPWQSTAIIAACTPPEERLVFHRLSDATLRQQSADQLRHRLVVVDQAEQLRPESALALRILKERGGIGWATLSGETTGDARGPVAVMAAAAGDLDLRCRDCFISIAADERPEATAAILAAQRQQHGDGSSATTAAQVAVITRHHALQRLLVRAPVIIPDADRIVFPAAQVRNRSEQAWFLGLVEAHALLHQRQRAVRDGAIVATEVDLQVAITLVQGVLAVSSDGLSRAGRELLGVLTSRQLATFTMADLAGLLPDWSRWAFRCALQDLFDFGYLESPPSGRGKLRRFILTMRSTATPVLGIRLRESAPVLGHDELHQVGGLAAVGGMHSANFTREVVNG